MTRIIASNSWQCPCWAPKHRAAVVRWGGILHAESSRLPPSKLVPAGRGGRTGGFVTVDLNTWATDGTSASNLDWRRSP